MKNDNAVKRLAQCMSVVCVRNTAIEEYHARGSLSQEDMKKLNKEVCNKIYTVLKYLLTGSNNEKMQVTRLLEFLGPYDWDDPVVDQDLVDAMRSNLWEMFELHSGRVNG